MGSQIPSHTMNGICMCLMVFPWHWLFSSGTSRHPVPCCRAQMRKCPPVASAGGSAAMAVPVAVGAAEREPRERRICNDYPITTYMMITCHSTPENHPPTAIQITIPVAEFAFLQFLPGHFVCMFERTAFYIHIYIRVLYLLLFFFCSASPSSLSLYHTRI